MMTVAITRNLPNRFDGFLRSCMHEIAPGVYVSPDMNKGVRERLWAIIMEWNELIPIDGGVVIFWKNKSAPSGLSLRLLGWPKKEFVSYEGCWLTQSNITESTDMDELRDLIEINEPPIDEQDPVKGLF